jgi:CubicO group peptidase (beta-lactamase class C family)
MYADGELYSTVDDLYLWDQALYTNSVLSEKSVEALLEPRMPDPDGPGCSVSYSFEVCPERGQQFVFGWIEGYISVLVRYPKDRITVIILSNEGDIDVGRIADEMMDKVFGYH